MEKFNAPNLSKYEFTADGKVFGKESGKEVKTTKGKHGITANLYKDDGKRGIVFIDKLKGVTVSEEKTIKAVKGEKPKKAAKAVKEKKAELEYDKEKAKKILSQTSSKTKKIRELGEMGLPCAEIGSLMGIKPQFAYNVLFYNPSIKAKKK